MQSRDTYGVILDNDDDNYLITFTGPNGGTSGQFYVTAVY